jgi:hypothetical protein
MTPSAWKMLGRAGSFRDGRIRIPPMTKQTGKPRMIATVVLKLRVVESFGKLHLALRRLKLKRVGRARHICVCQRQSERDRDQYRERRRRKIFIES